ncbi:hypothetical protein [Pedobacter steynii]
MRFLPITFFNTEQQYLERFPGNEWVDMLGMDNYGDMGRDGKYNLDAAIKKLRIVSAYAQKMVSLRYLQKQDWNH